MMLFLETVHVCLRTFSLTLQVLSTGKTRIRVQVDESDGAYLFKVKVEDVSLDLPQVRAVPPRSLIICCCLFLIVVQLCEIKLRLPFQFVHLLSGRCA
jgi:hypothetical protein